MTGAFSLEDRPWLTVAAFATAAGAVLILLLALALWQLPTWRQNLAPIHTQAQQQNDLAVLRLPQQVWITQPRLPKVKTEQPRYITNATPVTIKPNTPIIAVVIDDMGVAEDLSTVLVEQLPKEVTLAFLPYGKATQNLSQLARMKGHEIMIHLPMQPKSKESRDAPGPDPGPHALYVADAPAFRQEEITHNLNSLKNISVGVNNHMGSAFTSDEDGMRQVLANVQQERMFFMDSVTTGTPATRKLHKNFALPILERTTFLDHYIETDKINEYLKKTEERARKNGYAIAIGHPHAATREALKAWIPTLEEKGLQLVPITAMLKYAK